LGWQASNPIMVRPVPFARLFYFFFFSFMLHAVYGELET
jgi:hypothetical protein